MSVLCHVTHNATFYEHYIITIGYTVKRTSIIYKIYVRRNGIFDEIRCDRTLLVEGNELHKNSLTIS